MEEIRRIENHFFDDMIGKKFGKLLVLERTDDYISPKGERAIRFLCQCDCGNYKIAKATRLKMGRLKSCGCLVHEHITRLNNNKRGQKRKENKYDLSGDYGIGYTAKGDEFYFDLEDYERIKKICWVKGTGGYITGRLVGQNRNIEMQRYIMNVTDHNLCVDHIKTENKNDNRKQNLRIVTKSENNKNHRLRSDNKSGFTGVRFNKQKKKWIANITCNKKVIYLGTFNNIEDAIEARKAGETKYFGEYGYKRN